jgi:UDP-N-acetylglucosamine 2-epimerase (non-hydrolysing)
VTLRYNTERPETALVGANRIAGVTPDEILEAAEAMDWKEGDWDVPFGDGKAAERIVKTLFAAVE